MPPIWPTIRELESTMTSVKALYIEEQTQSTADIWRLLHAGMPMLGGGLEWQKLPLILNSFHFSYLVKVHFSAFKKITKHCPWRREFEDQ